MAKLLFIGNSHLGAFARAQISADRDDVRWSGIQFKKITDPRYKRCIRLMEGKPSISGAFRTDIQECVEDGYRLVSCVGGNAHNVLGLVKHPQPFDFVDPTDPDLPLVPGTQLISYQGVATALQKKIASQVVAVRAINTIAPITHLETPPPLHDDDLDLERIGTLFQSQGAEEFGVTDASIRMKLWRLHGRLFKEALAADGIPYLPSPKAVARDDGYLRTEFCNSDPTHANEAFGNLFLDDLIAYFDAKEERATA